jgi:hypothetical protein
MRVHSVAARTPAPFSPHSTVSRAVGYGLDRRGDAVRILVGAKCISCPVSYPLATGGSFLRGKAAGA